MWARSRPPTDLQARGPADTFEGCDYVTPDMIGSQVAKLNQGFNPSNFNFQLATTDYTNRSAWCGRRPPCSRRGTVPHPACCIPAERCCE